MTAATLARHAIPLICSTFLSDMCMFACVQVCHICFWSIASELGMKGMGFCSVVGCDKLLLVECALFDGNVRFRLLEGVKLIVQSCWAFLWFCCGWLSANTLGPYAVFVLCK